MTRASSSTAADAPLLCGPARQRRRATPAGTWRGQTPERTTPGPKLEFLDERQHRAVIGDQITLAMNARGKAVAAWSPTSLDEGGFRVSEFSFATGWANPRRLGDFAYLPSALVTESGSTVVTLNFSDPPDWVYRHPGADWVVGGQINNGEPMGAFGDGQRMATLYRTGRHRRPGCCWCAATARRRVASCGALPASALRPSPRRARGMTTIANRAERGRCVHRWTS